MLSINHFSVIGADILDKTNQNAFSFGRLREDNAWYELEDHQAIYFEEVKYLASNLDYIGY